MLVSSSGVTRNSVEMARPPEPVRRISGRADKLVINRHLCGFIFIMHY